MEDSTFADIDFSDFSDFIFKILVEIVEEELDGIEMDGILNLENLSRPVSVD